MEHPGHLEGMLDRDQRTAKLRFFNESDIKPVPKTYSFQDMTANGSTPAKRHCYCPTRTKRSSSSNSTYSSHLACRNGYLLNTFHSVKNVLLIVCLTLVTLPSANSSPINMDRMNLRMKWINPCDTNPGGDVPENTRTTEFNSSELGNIIRDATFALNQATSFIDNFSKIIDEAASALDKATGFYDNFTSQTFGKGKETVHNDLKNQKLTWLKTEWLEDKQLNENINDDQLASLKIETVLVNVYETFQRLAVGLEQITWDQHDNGDKFEKDFDASELHLKRVLCELYNVIEAHGLDMPQDATRDIMSQDDRDTTNQAGKRKTRDWIIFRDYINTLQFLKQALEHLMKNLTES